ncbi:MAG TPA: hypothetical protein VGK76_04690 [Candidatus Eisenbacteria bacterium]
MTDLGYSVASFLVRRLPPAAIDPLLNLASDLYVLAHPGRARAVSRNLAWIWSETRRPGPPPRARQTYRAFARVVRDFLAHEPEQGSRVRLSEPARAALRTARLSGSGIVLVSGHFGPWERALQWLAAELGGVEALAAPHRLAAVDRFFVEQRARGGVRTLCSSRPVKTALEKLKTGAWIAALVDRPRRSPGGEGIVPIDPGPLLLARRARALVIPGVSRIAGDGAIEIEFDRPFSLDPTQGGLDISQGIARLQEFFDAHVRAHPTQWFQWRCARSLGAPGL